LPSFFSRIGESSLVQKYNFALSRRDEAVKLLVSGDLESRNIMASSAARSNGVATVDGISLETFMARAGIRITDLSKIKIEGAEVGLFEAASDDAFSNNT